MSGVRTTVSPGTTTVLWWTTPVSAGRTPLLWVKTPLSPGPTTLFLSQTPLSDPKTTAFSGPTPVFWRATDGRAAAIGSRGGAFYLTARAKGDAGGFYHTSADAADAPVVPNAAAWRADNESAGRAGEVREAIVQAKEIQYGRATSR